MQQPSPVNTVNGDTGIKVVGTNGSYPGIVKQVNYNFGGVAPKLQVLVIS